MEDEIDLKKLFKEAWNRKIGIIAIILIFVVLGTVYTTFFVTPKYEASSTVILAKSGEGDVTQTDLNINDKLVATYSELVKSDSVLKEVINNLKLTNTNAETLKKQISVTAVEKSQVIKITVKNIDSSLAAKIANETTEVFSGKVSEVYKMDNIYSLDKAEIPTAPYNINHQKDITIFALIGVVVAGAYVLLASMLDNTVKTAEDIEQIIKLPVLAELPVCDFNTKKGRKNR